MGHAGTISHSGHKEIRIKRKKVLISISAPRGRRAARVADLKEKAVIGMLAAFVVLLAAIYVWPIVAHERIIVSSTGQRHTVSEAANKIWGGTGDITGSMK